MGESISLPKPPSINHIYGYTSRGGFARSYITKEGREWFESATEALAKQWHRPVIKSNVEIYIELHTAFMRQDVDNVLKPILDLLQKNKVIENDHQVIKLDIEKYKCKKEEQKVVVEILNMHEY